MSQMSKDALKTGKKFVAAYEKRIGKQVEEKEWLERMIAVLQMKMTLSCFRGLDPLKDATDVLDVNYQEAKAAVGV